jgi:hypothetical protein
MARERATSGTRRASHHHSVLPELTDDFRLDP